MSSPISKIFLKLINFYQIFLSFDNGLLAVFAPGGACKFEVSCSEYTKRMVMKYGIFKGVLLGVRRVGSCR